MGNSSEIQVVNRNNKYYYFKKNSVFTLFRMNLLDYENISTEVLNKHLNSMFTSSRLRYKVINDCNLVEPNVSYGFRENYTDTIDVYSHSLLLSVEMTISFFDSFKNTKNSIISKFEKNFELNGFRDLLKATPISLEDVPSYLYEMEDVNFSNPLIYTPITNIGVLKLRNLSKDSIDPDILAKIKDNLRTDYTIITNILPLSATKSEIEIARLNKNREGEDSLKGVKKKIDAEHAQADISLNSESIFQIDMTILIRGKYSFENHLDLLNEAKRLFSNLGDFVVEKYISKSSYFKSLIGERQFYSLCDTSNKIYPYLPCFTLGDGFIEIDDDNKKLPLLRKDRSISYYNFFDKKSSSHNHLIIGQTGSGKSVLTGLIIENLVNREDTVIKILDVGSSHTQTVKDLNGSIHSFSLSEPTGLNPFEMVTSKNMSKEEKVSLLSEFVSNLILENEELYLSREMQTELQSVIGEYVEKYSSSGEFVTINHFIENSSDFTRKAFLKRFGKNGIYKYAFLPKDTESSFLENDLEYYDFKEIYQAADKSYAKAGISALITCFTYAVISDKERKKCLCIDEAPFVIADNYQFISHAASNLRKYGGFLLIISQTLGQLCPGGKTTLVDQIKNKFLFSRDGNKDFYKETLNISESIYEKIGELQSEHKIESDVLFTNGDINKTFSIALTPYEYYRLTTDSNDRNKLKAIKGADESLSDEEVIRIYEWIEYHRGKEIRRN